MANLNIEELEPRYCSNKSFYKKAHVVTYNGYYVLKSYGLNILAVKNNLIVTTDNYAYSNTTSRHVHEFLKQYYTDLSSKDLGRVYKLNPWDEDLSSLDDIDITS